MERQLNEPAIHLADDDGGYGRSLFASHEVLAKVLTGTGSDDTPRDRQRRSPRWARRRRRDRRRRRRRPPQGTRRGRRDEGGSSNDEIFPGNGDDDVDAGAGNDLIYARDTDGVDYIDCGEGSTRWRPYTATTGPRQLRESLGPRQGDI